MAQRKQDIVDVIPEMVEMYESGSSTNKIAKHFGVGHETVRRRLMQTGIELDRKLHYQRDSKMQEAIKPEEIIRLKKNLKIGDMIVVTMNEPDPTDRTITHPVRRKYCVTRLLPHGVQVTGNGKKYVMITYLELLQESRQNGGRK